MDYLLSNPVMLLFAVYAVGAVIGCMAAYCLGEFD